MAQADDNKQNGIPDSDPSKAMNSRRDVEQSPDEKTDQDFPGYPHYPAKEDIMDQRTDSHRVDMDVENLPNNRNRSGVSERFQQAMSPQPGSGNDDLDITMGNESDV